MDYLPVLLVLVATCVAGPPKCRVSEFFCDTGQCVALDRYCDGEDDCGDKSDEPRYCSRKYHRDPRQQTRKKGRKRTTAIRGASSVGGGGGNFPGNSFLSLSSFLSDVPNSIRPPPSAPLRHPS